LRASLILVLKAGHTLLRNRSKGARLEALLCLEVRLWSEAPKACPCGCGLKLLGLWLLLLVDIARGLLLHLLLVRVCREPGRLWLLLGISCWLKL
jgi:hypothetical protein